MPEQPLSPDQIPGYQSSMDVEPDSSSGSPDVVSASSTDMGVPEGASPGPGNPPPQLADGTSRDKVVPYERLEALARENRELKERLEGYKSLEEDPAYLGWAAEHYGGEYEPPPSPGEVYQSPVAPAPAQDPTPAEAEDELSKYIAQGVRQVVGDDLKAMKKFIEEQGRNQRLQQAQLAIQRLKDQEPDFDPNRDGPLMARLIKRHPGLGIEGAWKILAYDRIRQATPQTAEGVHDIGGSAPTSAPATGEQMLKSMQEAPDQFAREEHAQRYMEEFLRRTGMTKLVEG